MSKESIKWKIISERDGTGYKHRLEFYKNTPFVTVMTQEKGQRVISDRNPYGDMLSCYIEINECQLSKRKNLEKITSEFEININ